jgi:hypothetical protein
MRAGKWNSILLRIEDDTNVRNRENQKRLKRFVLNIGMDGMMFRQRLRKKRRGGEEEVPWGELLLRATRSAEEAVNALSGFKKYY